MSHRRSVLLLLLLLLGAGLSLPPVPLPEAGLARAAQAAHPEQTVFLGGGLSDEELLLFTTTIAGSKQPVFHIEWWD